MSESTMQSATELASQYSVQVTDDLERNVKEQERVSAEITALQQQLAALQHDHALLVNMQQALGITSPPQSAPAQEPAAAAGAATVPAPRGGAASRSAAGKSTRSKKATAAPKRAAASKPGAKTASKPGAKTASKPTTKKATRSTATKSTETTDKAPAQTAGSTTDKAPAKSAAKTAGKPAAKKAAARDAGRPTLVELVREHLAGQREPRSAAEVTTALSEAHSGRAVKTTVVRTTLEGLVAKNQAQRTKQGTSVYYTATEAAAPERKQDPATEAPAPSGN
ncbi:hypothetical protein KBZ94_25635 [Streptomyces sp. RM72]|uniref:hypothetical protein n=1 Tax=unclassified Streptomyces TaxID=2593676 RepID=UPI000EF57D7A|nr:MULTISPECIES: hypothetical protein [unclassified Streptomyces]MBQ0888265.1 hypothetical protein [Streptomyces sp. RM72]